MGWAPENIAALLTQLIFVPQFPLLALKNSSVGKKEERRERPSDLHPTTDEIGSRA